MEVTAAQGAADGRNQAFFVLMGGARLVGEAPCAGKILRRTAVQRGLDRFPVMGGLRASATGWEYNQPKADRFSPAASEKCTKSNR